MKNKYVTTKISGVINQIAKETEIKGYTEGILEIFFPDDDVIENWTEKENEDWITTNNLRMIAICKFLNENNL